jgi:transcriptional regulator with XRE-family HTH domain
MVNRSQPDVDPMAGFAIVAGMKWWERLAEAMASRKLEVPDVATRAGVPVKTLYGYLLGEVENPRGDTIARLAAAVDMTEAQLRHEEEDLVTLTVTRLAKALPILEMSSLKTLKWKENALSRWEGDIVSFFRNNRNISNSCFAVRLPDSSGEPEFRRGDVIIFDQAADVGPGDYVVAVLPEEQQVHFAKYKPLSHRKTSLPHFMLVHRNADHPDIEVGGGGVKGFVVSRAVKHVRDI